MSENSSLVKQLSEVQERINIQTALINGLKEILEMENRLLTALGKSKGKKLSKGAAKALAASRVPVTADVKASVAAGLRVLRANIDDSESKLEKADETREVFLAQKEKIEEARNASKKGGSHTRRHRSRSRGTRRN